LGTLYDWNCNAGLKKFGSQTEAILQDTEAISQDTEAIYTGFFIKWLQIKWIILNLQPSEANMLPSTATASMASRFF
jgi:hypothetical protein